MRAVEGIVRFLAAATGNGRATHWPVVCVAAVVLCLASPLEAQDMTKTSTEESKIEESA